MHGLTSRCEAGSWEAEAISDIRMHGFGRAPKCVLNGDLLAM
jgi:hypothetical protein